MHLIALALAHLEAPSSLEIALLLVRGSPCQVLQHLLGRFPTGINRALKHLPTGVLRKQNYQLLIQLLDDSEAAKVLHHADQIDDRVIRVLAELPQKLRRPLPFTLPDWPRKLNGLTDSLRRISSRVGNSNDGPPISCDGWVLGQQVAPAGGHATRPLVGNGRRLDEVGTVCSLAGRWRNCLADYSSGIDAGSCAVYLWEDVERPAACLVARHGRLGWFLDQVKGPRNSEVEPDQLAAITAAFGQVGVPSSQAVRAIENIYEASVALRPMDEDW